MSSILDQVVSGTPLSLMMGAAVLLALALWLAWRRPGLALMFALAWLAVRPELLWGGPHIGLGWGLHRTLLVVALIANAMHFGLRKSINWPIVALIVVLGLNLLFGELHRELTADFMLTSLTLLALPFAVSHVMLDPEFRRSYASVIALTPLLSVMIGALLQLAGIHTMFANLHDRLEGATGNAAVFAMLAFAGFAVALHEAVREERLGAVALVSVNLALVMLSGTRMAILASAVLLIAYVTASEQLPERLRRNRIVVLLALFLVGAIVALYVPTLYDRMFEGLGRSDVWQYFYGEFLLSPFFGRGIGSGFLTEVEWPGHLERPYLPVPHNEYLHLLVIGGVLGLIVCLVGMVVWYWALVQAASPRDRQFLVALVPALVVYAMTDNILIYSSALGLYVYLGTICGSTNVQPSISSAEDGARHHRPDVVTHPEV